MCHVSQTPRRRGAQMLLPKPSATHLGILPELLIRAAAEVRREQALRMLANFRAMMLTFGFATSKACMP